MTKNAWLNLNEQETKEVHSFCDGYINFLNIARTERLANKEIIRQAEMKGYKNIETVDSLKPGDKVYVDQKGKAVLMFIIGKESIENGMNIVGSHIDSPRLDVKANPLYEDTDGIAKLKTHYYGGVKKYQYGTIPLAIHGVVFNKDGEKIEVNIGDDEKDPVFCVTDLLIHLSKDQMAKPTREALTGEQMNLVLGNIPVNEEDKEAVKKNILKLIKDKYNFEEEDFKVAELEVVPATKARELGLDRSMVLAYGHDDRICAYTSLQAILEVENPTKQLYVYLQTKKKSDQWEMPEWIHTCLKTQ